MAKFSVIAARLIRLSRPSNHYLLPDMLRRRLQSPRKMAVLNPKTSVTITLTVLALECNDTTWKLWL